MTAKPCLICGRPTRATRCSTCRSKANRRRDTDRGTPAQRGYGPAHQAERSAWAPLVATGTVSCRRGDQCVANQLLIQPGESWDLGHPDASCPASKAPEHAVCNRGAPNRGRRFF